jgi:hypothetical protein
MAKPDPIPSPPPPPPPMVKPDPNSSPPPPPTLPSTKKRRHRKKHWLNRKPSCYTQPEWVLMHLRENCVYCETRDHTKPGDCYLAKSLHARIARRHAHEALHPPPPPPPRPTPPRRRPAQPEPFEEDFGDVDDLDAEAYSNIDGEPSDYVRQFGYN